MNRRHVGLLFAVSVVWGSGYVLIKLAVAELAPEFVTFARVLIGALSLLVVLRVAEPQAWSAIPPVRDLSLLGTIGVLNSALPLFLLTWAETSLDSGLAAALQACTPLFTALLSVALVRERIRMSYWIGIVIGFLGVALIGGSGASGGGRALAVVAVLGSAACYAVAAVTVARRLAHVPAPAIAAWAAVAAMFVTFFPALRVLPAELPAMRVIAAITALGILGTALAPLLYYILIVEAGARYAVLVTYLVPAVAVVCGAAFLDEALGAGLVGGLLLVLTGVAIAGRIPRTQVPPAQS